MSIFRRNIEVSYKIVEISGNPKDVYKYLGVNKLCNLETIHYLCERFEKLFAIRKVTTYDNMFGIRKSIETPFIPEFDKDGDGFIATLGSLGLNHYNTFYIVGSRAVYASDWYASAYAFTAKKDAHKVLEAYFCDIEEKRLADIAEQELNNRTFQIHSEEVLK